MKTNEMKTKKMKTNVDFLGTVTKGFVAVMLVMTGLGNASAGMYEGISKHNAGECITCSSNTSLNDIRDNSLELSLVKASQLKESRVNFEEAPVAAAEDKASTELGELLLKASQLNAPVDRDDEFNGFSRNSNNDPLLEKILIQAAGLNYREQDFANAGGSDDLSLEEILVKASGLKGSFNIHAESMIDQVSMIN
jgi:hypothetical protein